MNRHDQKVLIVDDDDRNIFALRAVLTAHGFNCLVAGGSIQAMEILKRHKDIGVALIDMMMPGIDGYELMTMIRKIPSLHHIRRIAVTAQAMAGDREKCLAAGAEQYISKPVDIDLLLQVLNNTQIKKDVSNR